MPNEFIFWQHSAKSCVGGEIPAGAEIIFELGEAKHEMLVSIESGLDGTVGIRVRSTRGPLNIFPRSGNEMYITSLRPQ